MTTVTGHCNCAAVAFEFDADDPGIFVCHCSICRRATGSNGIAVVLADTAKFRWTRGQQQISSWQKPDADWQMSFCNTCGSPLPGQNDDSRVFIPAGLIADGGENLRVLHHIWVDSKAGWDEIGDSGKRHPEAYEG